MTTKSLPLSLPQRGGLGLLRRLLRGWWLALGPGQDGPAGRLPEDLAGRAGG